MTDVFWVATLVAPQGAEIGGHAVEGVVQNISASHGKIENITRLDGDRAVDVFFFGSEHFALPQQEALFDIILQPVATRRKKLLVADMESTIIEQEMLDELASRIGCGEKTADITRRAMNGALDFETALMERVALLKGQPEKLLQETAACMTLSAGAQALVAAMQRAGGKAWLVSGGFTCFIKPIAEKLGFDRFFGNALVVHDGVLTGDVTRPILGKDAKKTLLEQACAEYGCTLGEAVAIGDGANDVPMLLACQAAGGLGIAYRAKPRVREVIAQQINHSDLSALIYAQGIQL